MLNILFEAERELPKLLEEPVDSWNSLDVNYEPPRVERLWRPYKEDYRLYLHRIHPCEKALYHPHSWPSAIRIITGQYEMGVGTAYGGKSYHKEFVKTILSAGSAYEIVDPHIFHYVKPLQAPSLSLMITGKPYEKQIFNHDKFGKSANLAPLKDKEKQALYNYFKFCYNEYISSIYEQPIAIGKSKKEIFKIAEEYAEAVDFQVGDRIEALVNRLGGKIVYIGDVNESIYVYGPKNFVINIYGDGGLERNRRSIADGLGHYILHSKAGEKRIKITLHQNYSNIDYEAYCFTKVFLVPEEGLKTAYRKHNGVIEAIAARYLVKPDIIRDRLSDIFKFPIDE